MTKAMGKLPNDWQLASLRTRLRKAEFGPLWPNNWDTGGCAFTSEVIAVRYGVEQDGGCYVTEDGTHIAHMWNVLPDGTILDVTADQFHDEDLPHGVRRAAAGDERYNNQCDGDTCGAI